MKRTTVNTGWNAEKCIDYAEISTVNKIDNKAPSSVLNNSEMKRTKPHFELFNRINLKCT